MPLWAQPTAHLIREFITLGGEPAVSKGEEK
jgi:hypothetical protein